MAKKTRSNHFHYLGSTIHHEGAVEEDASQIIKMGC